MFFHRAGTDAEDDGDLRIRFAERCPMRDLHFAARKDFAQARMTFDGRVRIKMCDGDSKTVGSLG